MTLYELEDRYRGLLMLMEEEDLDEEALMDTMSMIEDDIEDKAEGYAIIMKELEGECEKFKREEERLKRRRQSYENHISTMKDALESAMRLIGKTKFKTEHFSFGIQKNGGNLPVIIEDPESLPESFKVYTWRPDTEKLRNYLTAMGGNIGYAHLGERGESLRIR